MKICYIVIVLSLFISACEPVQKSASSPENKNTDAETSSLTIKSTSSSELDEAPWENRCGVTQAIETGVDSIPASIVIYLSGGTNKIIRPDLTVRDFELSHEPFLNVSPGGKWFSYWQTYTENNRHIFTPVLEIQSVSGDEHYEHIVPSSWFPRTPWYSPDYLRIVDEIEEGKRRSILLTPAGEQLTLPWSNLPNLSQTLFQTNIWESPDYLIYRTQSTTIALWDIKNENSVWESEKGHYINNEFIWSPDGKYVAFLGSPLEGNSSGLLEAFILSTEGQLYQMTKFNKYFDDYSLQAFKWSLDGDKLLFNLQDNEEVVDGWFGYQYHLFMIDISSHSILRFCVSGYDAVEPWSPDSSTIAFIGTVDDQSKLMILNIT